MLRVANDAGAGRRDRLAGERDVAELFVLVAEFPAFDAAVQGRALDARGEVAPIGRSHRAGAFGGAGRDHAGAGGEKRVPDGANQLEAAGGAGFDQDQGAAGGLPQARGMRGASGFAERVSGDHQVALGNSGGEIAHEAFGIGKPLAGSGGEGEIAFDHGDGGIGKPGARGERGGAGACAGIENRGDGAQAVADFVKHPMSRGVRGGHAGHEISSRAGVVRKTRGAAFAVRLREGRGGALQFGEAESFGARFDGAADGLGKLHNLRIEGSAEMAATTSGMLEVRTRREWRDWLQAHHDSESEIWLVLHKHDTTEGSITYADIVEEALCFGWIDSIVKRLDADRYARKVTPRKPGSKWSSINRRRYEDLKARGLLEAPGLKRAPTSRSGDAPRPSVSTIPSYIETQLKANPRAWNYFEQLAPSYRRLYIGWIDSGKRQETREKRLREAIGLLAAAKKLGLR